MQRDEISAKIRAFLESKLVGKAEAPDDQANLLEEWFVESLQLIETVMFLENEFGIEISRADITGTNFATVASMTDFVAQSLAR